MATCPKCQLPNPDTAGACIWCGQHRFEPAASRSGEAAAVGEAAAASETAAAGETAVDGRPAEIRMASTTAVPVVVQPQHPSPFVTSFMTPTTPPPEQKPLPSHLGLFFARSAQGATAADLPPGAPLTVADKTIGPAPPPPTPAQSSGVILPDPAGSTVAAVTPTTPPIRPKLVTLRGQKIGHEYPVYEGRNVIGRFADKPVDIDLIAQEAEGQIWSSRQHAAITFDKNLLLIEDLNSLNGTWVNGTRLHPGQQRPLKPNDVIQIGTVQLKVVVL